MKRNLLALAFFVLPLAAQTRDERWRQDVAFVGTELPQRHVNPFTRVSSADFQRALGQLSQAVPNLTDSEIKTELARIVALIGDGHTSLNLGQAAAGFNALPLELYSFDDGVYVLSAAAEYSRAVGARVLRIGQRSIREALDAVATVISHENDAWVRHNAPRYLALAELLQALKITPDFSVVRFELVDSAGQSFSVDVRPGGARTTAAPDPATGFVPLFRRDPQLNYWFTYVASARMLYMRYNRAQEMASLPIGAFTAQLLEIFDARPVDRLVIDFRDNPGGSSALLTTVFFGFLSRLDRLGNPTRLYGIIGRGTFSAAVDNAEILKDAEVNQGFRFIKLIGEPTGGKPGGFGEVLNFTLPNSRIVVSYSTVAFTSPFQTDSLLPSVSLPLYSSDYFARHDPFLAAVLADPVE